MNFLLYIVNNFTLIFFGYVISYNKTDKLYLSILKTFTIYMTEVLGIIILLGGILNKLNLRLINICCIIILVISLIFIKKKNLKLKDRFSFNKLKNIKFCNRILKCNDLIMYTLLIVSLMLIFKLFNVFFLLPYQVDATDYHLPNIVEYIKNGKFLITNKTVWANSYPKNIEMLFLWNLLYFKNGLTLNLSQYLLTVIGAVSIYAILLEQKIDKKNALFGALIFLGTPIIISQISVPYNDNALCSIFIMSMYFFIHSLNNDFQLKSIVYLAMTLSMLLGIKYSCLAYFAIILFFLIICMLNRKVSKAKIAINILCIMSFALLIGGFWYIYNYIHYMNPIYPFKLSLLNHVLFDGIDTKASIMISNEPVILKGKNSMIQVLISWIGIGSNSEITFKNIVVGTLITAVDQRIGGLGFQWILLLVPSIIVGTYITIKSKALNDFEKYIFTIIIICFLITPSNWWSRYVSFILLIGIYSFVKILQINFCKNNILMTKIMCAFILISCIQGSLFEVRNDLIVIKNYINNNMRYSIRSSYIQAQYLSKQENLNDILRIINYNNKAYTIDSFAVGGTTGDRNTYYYQGDFGQNNVNCYFSSNNYGNKNKNYNIDSYAKFSSIINSDKPDFIVIQGASNFVSYMQLYNKEYNDYVIVSYSKDLLMYKISPIKHY